MTTISASTSADSLPGARRSAGLAADFDGFLKLLTSQLEHQDPLSPLDATKFTSQLVEFASVEQAIRTNTRLDQLVDATTAGSRNAALDYLGNVVDIDTGLAELGAGGSAAFSYQLPTAASSVNVRILDGEGRVVRELPGGRQSGDNTIRWDGADADGRRQTSGLYRMEVSALDATGRALGVEMRTSGEVTGVRGLPDSARLEVGGMLVPVSAIVGVRRPAEV